MSLPIPQSSIDNVTGQFDLFFQQMSVGRNSYVTVIKEPIKVLNNPNQNILPGYGIDSNNLTDVSYISNTGVFPAVVIYGKNINLDKFVTLKFNIDINSNYLKVKEDAMNFILNGTKTEKVYVDNIAYIPANTPVIQNFFGLKYYYFKLNEIQ
jgi:hypothetical protein